MVPSDYDASIPVDTRIWKYRPGEAKLFNSPADVPAGEGWVDLPQPDSAAAVAAANADTGEGDGPYEDTSIVGDEFDQLTLKGLKRLGKGYGLTIDPSWTEDALRAAVRAAAAAAQTA